MRAVFVSDVHLRNKQEQRYRMFMNFLMSLEERKIPGYWGERVQKLFLLGDIFDFWFARKERIYPDYRPVLEKMNELREKGTEIHAFEGNHDFFLKEYFHAFLDAYVYEDWGDISLDGFRFLVAHGDLIDEKNRRYLLLRRALRSQGFYLLQRILPLKLVWRLAGFSSDLGKEKRQVGEEKLVETMYLFSQTRFDQGYDATIFGHCHLPRFYLLQKQEKNRVFAVLGDWLKYFTFLYYHDGNLHLMDLSGRNIGSGHLG